MSLLAVTDDMYRDDGLAILRDSAGPNTERIRKEVIRIFKQHGLQLLQKLV